MRFQQMWVTERIQNAFQLCGTGKVYRGDCEGCIHYSHSPPVQSYSTSSGAMKAVIGHCVMVFLLNKATGQNDIGFHEGRGNILLTSSWSPGYQDRYETASLAILTPFDIRMEKRRAKHVPGSYGGIAAAKMAFMARQKVEKNYARAMVIIFINGTPNTGPGRIYDDERIPEMITKDQVEEYLDISLVYVSFIEEYTKYLAEAGRL
jgi:hypothetical protein